jgi:hypothetical protein
VGSFPTAARLSGVGIVPPIEAVRKPPPPKAPASSAVPQPVSVRGLIPHCSPALGRGYRPPGAESCRAFGLPSRLRHRSPDGRALPTRSADRPRRRLSPARSRSSALPSIVHETDRDRIRFSCASRNLPRHQPQPPCRCRNPPRRPMPRRKRRRSVTKEQSLTSGCETAADRVPPRTGPRVGVHIVLSSLILLYGQRDFSFSMEAGESGYK